nr:MAG TPA: hypothetical protein [Caudoviricetes sp.]
MRFLLESICEDFCIVSRRSPILRKEISYESIL